MRNVMKSLGALAVMLGALTAQAANAADPKQVPPMIKILVPFSAGASNDAIARAIAPSLARRLQTTVIVENKPGAAGSIGAETVAKSRPDGSVLLLTSSTFLTSAATQAKLPYDPINAFAPVAMVGQGPMLVAVTASQNIRTPAELVAAAKNKPGVLTYGSSGNGSIAHLSAEMLSKAAGISFTHVPYKGAANALLDMASGQIDMMISNYSSLAPQIQAGRVKALAVTTKNVSSAFPLLPTMESVAPGFSADIWVSILAPAGTPAPVVQMLNQAIVEIAKEKEVLTLLEMDGTVPTNLSPEAVKARIQEDLQVWKQIAVEKNILVQ